MDEMTQTEVIAAQAQRILELECEVNRRGKRMEEFQAHLRFFYNRVLSASNVEDGRIEEGDYPALSQINYLVNRCKFERTG